MNAINPSALSTAQGLQTVASAKPAQDNLAASTSAEDRKAPIDPHRSRKLDESQSPQVPPRLLWVRQTFMEFIERLSDAPREDLMIANSAERDHDQAKAMSDDRPASRSELSEQPLAQASSLAGQEAPASKEARVYQRVASDAERTEAVQSEAVRIDSKA